MVYFKLGTLYPIHSYFYFAFNTPAVFFTKTYPSFQKVPGENLFTFKNVLRDD